MTHSLYALFVIDGAKASDDLVSAGFECWHFTYKRFRAGAHWQLRNVNGRTRVAVRPPVAKEAPIFPGYVFARIPAGGFREALELPRVIGAVKGASGSPRAMPEKLIGDMILLVMSGKHDETTAPPPKTINLDKPVKAAVVPKNRARSRKRRKGAASRLKKWLTEAEPQHLARAA